LTSTAMKSDRISQDSSEVASVFFKLMTSVDYLFFFITFLRGGVGGQNWEQRRIQKFCLNYKCFYIQVPVNTQTAFSTCP
jgi:hypothetical protein